MNDLSKLVVEIFDRLQFYQEMGVQWGRPISFAPTRPSTETSAAGPRVPSAALPGPPKNVRGKPPVFLEQSRSMFDVLPVKDESLVEIRSELGDCRRCKLSNTRKNIVFGSGNPHAELMFVGEAPGADEDEQGLPFVGRAGQLLTKIIEAMGMKREDVYICNILKCRPPDNRNPESEEITSCEPFLLRQIASVRPKVICALGTFGAQTLLRTREPISKIRGHFIEFRGSKLIATFHPAYLLRNPAEKRKVWEDVQKIRDYLISRRPS